MSRRSARSVAGPKQAEVPSSVRLGLASIVQGKEVVIRSMLDCDKESEDEEGRGGPDGGLVTKLLEVMGVNSLGAEVRGTVRGVGSRWEALGHVLRCGLLRDRRHGWVLELAWGHNAMHDMRCD